MLKSSDSFSTSYSLNSNSNKEIFTDWISRWSASKKKPIVFIHGVGLNKEIWKPQIDYFNEYPILCYDLLGHGETPLKKAKIKGIKRKKFINDFNILSVQRSLKIIGIFSRLFKRDKKNRYLKLIPYTWKILEKRMESENFLELRKILEKNISTNNRNKIIN